MAYALGRSVGSAVARNRLRRQLREVVRANSSNFAPGWYLVGADAPALAMSFSQLSQTFPALAATGAQRNAARQANERMQ